VNFKDLRKANVERDELVFGECKDWEGTDWGCAIAGEVGELCNAIKKLKRGDGNIEKVRKELGDVLTYADLLANYFGFDLEKVIIDRFNYVSDRRKCDIKLK